MSAETPSGKGAGDENFPVGSFLLPARLRPHVAVFYAYARAIDDVADNPDLAAEEKIRRLEGFAATLVGASDDPAYAKAAALRDSLAATGVSARHGLDLISAFKQDAIKSRYAAWDELIDYCDRSAAPVGRYLLDLHGEDVALYAFSDPLCNALQVINHLQDCAEDYAEMNRVYIPQDWLGEAGESTEALSAGAASRPLRTVMDRMLDETKALLAEARPLAKSLNSMHLGLESGVIWALARDLTCALERRDPLADRVAFSKLRAIPSILSGLMIRFTG